MYLTSFSVVSRSIDSGITITLPQKFKDNTRHVPCLWLCERQTGCPRPCKTPSTDVLGCMSYSKVALQASEPRLTVPFPTFLHKERVGQTMHIPVQESLGLWATTLRTFLRRLPTFDPYVPRMQNLEKFPFTDIIFMVFWSPLKGWNVTQEISPTPETHLWSIGGCFRTDTKGQKPVHS